MNQIQEKEKMSRRMQSVAAWVFVAMFSLQFIFQSLIFFRILSPEDSWYAFIVACLSVMGFCILYKLASNMTSEIFALSMICAELFFLFSRPYVLSVAFTDKPTYSVVFYLCVLFSVLALFMWTVLFKNCHFRSHDFPWLLVLPLPFVINILGYAGYLSFFGDVESLATMAIQDPTMMALLRMSLDVFLIIGYWKLCHSQAFSYSQMPTFDQTKLNPFNYYVLGYGALIVILLMPVSVWRALAFWAR